MKFIEQFNHQISGPDHAPKLVFLHGLMGFLGNWRRITPAFEKDYQILTYDQRGHGRSFKPKEGYRPENFADDLKSILDELGWEKIYLVGHSMGGRNAMNFAFRFAHRIEKLVIEDIGPDASQEAIVGVEKMLNKIPTPFADKKMAKEFFLNDFHDPVLGSYLYSNLEEKPNKEFDWRFSKPAILESLRQGRVQDRWNEMDSLKVPTLLIRGEKSDELPKNVFEEVMRRNQNIKGVEIKNAGHWVHFDQADEFISVVKNFFNDT